MNAPRLLLVALSLSLFAACDGSPEPLVLPDDPAERGVPVGATTIHVDDLTFEVFYPASDKLQSQHGEDLDVNEFVPEVVVEHLGGDILLPELVAGVHRDTPVRVGDERWPIVFFSHGFGAFRVQSVDYAVHLASRGYVVVAPDHPGRMLGDILPCIFDPQLDGCNLTGFLEDPGPDDILDALEWMEAADLDPATPFFERLDLTRLALSGHSAGGATTFTLGNADERFVALMPMAMAGTLEREVPALITGGTCDFVADGDALAASFEGSPGSTLFAIDGAGHLAFSDICEVDLGAFADELLVPRDDMNSTYLEQLLSLATDGCEGYSPAPDLGGCDTDSFADLDGSHERIRYYSTVFFDAVLRESGPGVVGGEYDGVDVRVD